MQPTAPLSSDIQNISDWVFKQFAPTDAVRVKNILNQPYSFRYCVGEEATQPDQYTKIIVDRRYRDVSFEADEEQTLMGAAAYLFVEGVARAYVLKNRPDKPAALEALVQAAQRVIIGTIDVYAQPLQKQADTAAADAEEPDEPAAPAQAPAEEEEFAAASQDKAQAKKSGVKPSGR